MKKKSNICTKCGSQLDDEQVCPYCGQPVPPDIQEGPVMVTYGAVGTRPPKKGSHAGLIAGLITILFFTGMFIIVIASSLGSQTGESSQPESSAGTEQPSKVLILDAPALAGATLEKVQAKLGESEDEGQTELTTKDGIKVMGRTYTFVEGTVRILLVENKTVCLEYHAVDPVVFSREKDIFPMFGIETAGNLDLEISRGKERQYVSVSETVSQFRVESLDAVEKTFQDVQIMFDSTFGGRLSSEAKPADLEVLETNGTKDYITGKVRNNTRKTYGYVEVNINLYHADGVQVGSAMDNVTNLEPGKIWEFKAPVLEDGVKSYKIVRVKGS